MATKATASPASPTTPRVVPPKFDQLVDVLSAADNKARSKAADATQARGERSAIAVSTILAAHREKLDPENVRATLLEATVLKGTVSKIVTVIEALNASVILPVEVESLNGAYSLVKRIEASPLLSTPTPVPTVAPEWEDGSISLVKEYATTPEEALKVILASITGLPSADEKFKVGGEWLTRFTNEISAIMKEIGDDE